MLKVLLVDDEPFIIQGLKVIIDWENEGFEIAGMVSNGKEALQFLENENVDLVIADIRMPEMTGLELLETLRKDKKSDVYFCIYEKDYEQYVKLGTPLEEADIINRFEIRLRNERAYYAVRDLLTYYDAEQTAFSIINQYVRFVDEEPDKRKNDWKLNDRWAWFIGDNRQSLKLTTKPEPYTLERTLRWVQRQVAPTLKMLKKIDKGNGTDYMETIEQQAKLTEKHEMIIKQQTTPAKDLVES